VRAAAESTSPPPPLLLDAWLATAHAYALGKLLPRRDVTVSATHLSVTAVLSIRHFAPTAVPPANDDYGWLYKKLSYRLETGRQQCISL